ncbi:MAG: flippase-like domain-containing protein, partial [Verrucomicrobia bacterium]|nr:flippase-like domain-containing protein [Verrucomicrobiota bacterium]
STAVGRRAEAVSTVFLDRFLGIIGLIGVLLISVMVNLHQSPEYRPYWVYSLIALAVSALIVVLLFNKRLLKKLPFVMRLYVRLPYRDRVTRVYDAFHFYRTRPWEIVFSLLLSLVVHVTTALEACLFGSAVGLPYTFPEYMLLLSLTNFVASIPVSPVGNIGTLEGACIIFFGHGDPALKGPALALAILIRIAYLLWGIPGLIYFLTHREEIPHQPIEETVDVIERDVDGAGCVQPQEVPAND